MRNNAFSRGEQVTSAGVTNYNFGFPIEADTSVALYLAGARLNVGDYSISGANTASGFVVSLVNDPGANKILIALLDTPLQQTLELIRTGAIPSKGIEEKLDLLIEALQMFDERYRRTIRLPETSLDEDITAPDYVPDMWWAYDPTQKKIILKSPPGGAAGAQGPAGPGILFGSGAPSASLGTVNATYIDDLIFDVYSKTDASTWTLKGSAKGAKGDQGDDGTSATVGVAGGRATVANGQLTAGTMSVTLDLSGLSLPDANYQFLANFSWPNIPMPTPALTPTAVTVNFSSEVPSDGVMMWAVVARGDIILSTTLPSHDHTAVSGAGGVLTRTAFDSYTDWEVINPPPAPLSPSTVRVYPDATFGGGFKMIFANGRVINLGQYSHGHSGSLDTFGGHNDGAPLHNALVDSYLDIAAIGAPEVPGVNRRRLYIDTADSHLKAVNNAGVIVDLDNPSSTTAPGTFATRGLLGTNNASAPTTQFDLSAWAWEVKNSSNQIVIVAPGSKTLNIAVAGANGRDQVGAFSASNWLYIYGIWNGTTAAVLASLTAPATGPTLPSTYTHWTFLTALRLNASTQIVPCYVRGQRVFYASAQRAAASTAASGSEDSFSIAAQAPPIAAAFGAVLRVLDDNVSIRLVAAGSAIMSEDAGVFFRMLPYVGTSLYHVGSGVDAAFHFDIDGYQLPQG